MKILLLTIGKTDRKELKTLVELYTKRLNRYLGFQMEVIPDLKKQGKLSEEDQKQREGELILSKINASDTVILFDEKGSQFSSVQFAGYLQKHMNSGIKKLVFVIGGPYGFSEAVYARANGRVSLSKMTFSHQMVRLFCIEQIYRWFTILRNEPYHHN